MKERFLNLGQIIFEALRIFFHRKRLIRYAIYLGILFIIWLCRYPILRGFGNYLMDEDTLEKAEAVYVLGGSSEDRSAMAVQLYKEGYSDRFFTTGEHLSKELELLDTLLTEADITAIYMIKKGIPKSKITVLKEGTSTREEADFIYSHAEGKYKKIIILSSRFHMRRVRNVFEEKFEGSGIEVIFIGAKALDYEEEEWWKYEKGLIMVNNEYLKLFYYWWTE